VRAAAALVCFLMLAACGAATEPSSAPVTPSGPNAAGLVPLPCDSSVPLAPLKRRYCDRDRHYVKPDARDALTDAATRLAEDFPGLVVRFMDGSGPEGIVPFPPHLSHGDGRQIDLALYYTDRQGRPLAEVPDTREWGGYWPAEPPRPGERIACPQGREGRAHKPDPPANRPWRLDEERTRAMVMVLIADPRVRRVLIEPHLEERFGLWGHPKLRFAGCQAARHDDHVHVDFY
jgi:hypothetical protein